MIRVHSCVGPLCPPSSAVSFAIRTRAGAGGLLVVGLDGVLEVAEEHVDGADHLRDLGGHLLVRRIEEVDRAARASGDLGHGLRGADGERAEEVLA
ncbi:hypothetical protein [Nocardioides sp. B-3]|uniref:hypothetical protein n=1 Tax=Nocardioides sp. B-3 TaxID=2895565 RepID=UPI0021526960|nr:hypothetical protein [Nocardioides sp. B-3]UUZ61387.1 hypothetical protein LP418_12905 [Nocardioides sp. B-3]